MRKKKRAKTIYNRRDEQEHAKTKRKRDHLQCKWLTRAYLVPASSNKCTSVCAGADRHPQGTLGTNA